MKEYLTADVLRRAFEASGKRHLILTGGRGSGKTTLLGKLCSLPGITTWAVPREGVFFRDSLTGEVHRIGVFDSALPGKENRMRPDGVKKYLIPALESCIRCPGEWISVDEIGYLEAEDEDCRRIYGELFGQKRVICVLRKQDTPLSRELLGRRDVFTVDLDNPFGNAGCVIMASGLGKRFSPDGSRNKLTENFAGKPLIEWVLDAADGLFRRCAVVTRHADAAKLCEERGIHAVFHSLPYRSDTVRLGLDAVADTDGCLFCQGDQPLLTRETVMVMLLCGADDRDSFWRASWNGEGASPVLFPAWSYPELMDLPEGKGGGFLLKRYPERVKNVNVKIPAELRDIDTPQDLREMETIVNSIKENVI